MDGCVGGGGWRGVKDVKDILYEDVQAREFPEKNAGCPFEDQDRYVDAFVGQNHPHSYAFLPDGTQRRALHDVCEVAVEATDKDTLTRSGLARAFAAHRREGASISRAFTVGQRHFDERWRVPRSTATIARTDAYCIRSLPSLPSTRVSARTRVQFERPVMTPAPTVFSSIASSYEYAEDEEVGDEDGVGVRGRGRTPQLEPGVLYSPSQSMSRPPPRSESYSIRDEFEASSLAPRRYRHHKDKDITVIF
ncbi:hypothetical protein BD410DRAFT_868428 [Rickenella mellea]|uniref:Uncharacterized protein n=1 Tax=Rickenella mellea TaxID=50990 RepID=A0A4Y7Q163_9AGAM|nr:hypothetical protein BD410DRAFT_868428 [Rickenella mellea]